MLDRAQAAEMVDSLLARMAQEGWSDLVILGGGRPHARAGGFIFPVGDRLPGAVSGLVDNDSLLAMINHLLGSSTGLTATPGFLLQGKYRSERGERFRFMAMPATRSGQGDDSSQPLTLTIRSIITDGEITGPIPALGMSREGR